MVAITLEHINQLDSDGFVAQLGDIFEHSPWVAQAAWAQRPFTSVDHLHQSMVDAMWAADKQQQLDLICAHPQLAGKEAAEGTLTKDSQTEQASAGLDQCSAEELARLRENNVSYLEAYGFPFVKAIKGKTRADIFEEMKRRLSSDTETEFKQCLTEIGKIAQLRLNDLIKT